MLQFILQNKRVFILPTPTKLSIEHIEKFHKGIQNTPPAMLSEDASISLSPEAKQMVLDLSSMISQ